MVKQIWVSWLVYNIVIAYIKLFTVFRSDSDFPSPPYCAPSDKSSVKSIGGELLADYMNKVCVLSLLDLLHEQSMHPFF